MGTMETGGASDTTLDKPLSDERRRILRRVKRDLVRDMDANEVLLQMTAESIFNTTEEERIKVKPTRSEQNKQLLDILPTKGEKAYEIFKETLQEVHPPLANIILERGKCFDDHENQLVFKKKSCTITSNCNFFLSFALHCVLFFHLRKKGPGK